MVKVVMGREAVAEASSWSSSLDAIRGRAHLMRPRSTLKHAFLLCLGCGPRPRARAPKFVGGFPLAQRGLVQLSPATCHLGLASFPERHEYHRRIEPHNRDFIYLSHSPSHSLLNGQTILTWHPRPARSLYSFLRDLCNNIIMEQRRG